MRDDSQVMRMGFPYRENNHYNAKFCLRIQAGIISEVVVVTVGKSQKEMAGQMVYGYADKKNSLVFPYESIRRELLN